MKNKQIYFSQNDYEVVKREVLYQGVFRLAKYHLRFRLFNGGWSETVSREILERKSAVAVLPYDPITDQVILIQQFRPGALANTGHPWLLEVVAGIIDNQNDAHHDVARREAKEEAGCEILDLHLICEYFVSPGGSNERLALFCGRIHAANVDGVYGLVEENEDIKATTLPLDEALSLLQQGKIETSPAIISLQWLQLNREWLKKLWSQK